ncbi:MAG: class I SAM-dependent methyltransferase [Campylobacteraceae bacterium]|jgi:predicted O-methyltransferase YrrM|nr:class I SAM-dependent methyltransferase [Campylobacteraceae bacterium]
MLNENDKKNLALVAQLRASGMQDNSIIEFLDFGAGSPEDKRSEEEMAKGKRVQTTVGKLSSIGLKNEWSEWIYTLIKERKPKVVLELGTCCGFSSITMALANSDTKVYTIEGAKEIAAVAAENIKKAGCENITQIVGRFADVLDKTLAGIAPIDFAFIDGHHDRDATVKYYRQILPFMAKGSVMAFDDISWSDGMKEAWEMITAEAGADKCEHLGKIGICHID